MKDDMKDKVVLKNCPFNEEQVMLILESIKEHPEEYKELIKLKKEAYEKWRNEVIEKERSVRNEQRPYCIRRMAYYTTKVKRIILTFLGR